MSSESSLMQGKCGLVLGVAGQSLGAIDCPPRSARPGRRRAWGPDRGRRHTGRGCGDGGELHGPVSKTHAGKTTGRYQSAIFVKKSTNKALCAASVIDGPNPKRTVLFKMFKVSSQSNASDLSSTGSSAVLNS